MIKKIVLGLVFTAVTLFGAQVHWAKDYKSGIAEAQKENKPVLFIISRDTCKYCILLDKTTLKDERVAKALNRDFVAIRSWINEGDYIPREIAQNTPGLPGIWFLYSDGTPMFRPLLGYVQKDNFLKALAIVKTEFDKKNKRDKK
jgi:thioredoxin-related protein